MVTWESEGGWQVARVAGCTAMVYPTWAPDGGAMALWMIDTGRPVNISGTVRGPRAAERAKAVAELELKRETA